MAPTLSGSCFRLVKVFAITCIEHREGAAEQGHNQAVFVPPAGPLGELRDQFGGLTFAWLPDPLGAGWERVAALGLPLPTLMPRLTFPAQIADRRSCYGRPPAMVTARPRLELTAALVDLAGQSKAGTTRLMHGTIGDPTGSKELKMVRRDLAAARVDLARRYVLPWGMWQDGELPTEWWLSAEFEEAVHWWREDAAHKPVDAPSARTPCEHIRHIRQEASDAPELHIAKVSAAAERDTRCEQERRRLASRWSIGS